MVFEDDIRAEVVVSCSDIGESLKHVIDLLKSARNIKSFKGDVFS